MVIKLMSGNKAVAESVKLSSVQVIAAYPITPQTPIIEELSKMIANGEFDADMIHVESEHSAISACIGAAFVGTRTFTATCSQGLALMHECLFITSGFRLPIVMCITNRALSMPGNILNDHSDVMASRDCGWIQFWTETCQEVLDCTLMAYKVAETVNLPVMVNLDGFVLSHLYEPVELPDKMTIEDFLPEPDMKGPLLSSEQSGYFGPPAPAEYTEEFHYIRHQDLIHSKNVIKKTYEEFSQTFGREYELVDAYRCEDAEIILVGMGSVSGTVKDVVDDIRKVGFRVGLMNIRVFRPFPIDEIKKVLKNAKIVIVLDRTMPNGAIGGPVFREVSSAIVNLSDRPLIVSAVLGLGGRDISKKTIMKVIDEARKIERAGIDQIELMWPDVRDDVLKNWAVFSNE
jgi:pyruvate ferredoxin oxidoreductase alpha subunit